MTTPGSFPPSAVHEAPMMALRDVVIFPRLRRPLYVGRPHSLAALEQADNYDNRVVFVTQRDELTDQPASEDLYKVGCLAKLGVIASTEEGAKKVDVTGISRVHIEEVVFDSTSEMQLCRYRIIQNTDWPDAAKTKQYMEDLVVASKNNPKAVGIVGRFADQKPGEGSVDLSYMIDHIATATELNNADLQAILELSSVNERANYLLERLSRETVINRLVTEMHDRVTDKNRDHRNDYLKERAASIQKALGDGGQHDIGQLRQKVRESGMGEDAMKRCMTEIGRLATMTPLSPEASVIRTYIDVLLGLPWQERSEIKHDLRYARQVLDEDHKGLDKVKDRIIEYLAVQQKVKHNRGSVMCFLGPPGVGKTSLGQSIARATGRVFVRLALGGVHDEATIRGHRRTYVASMPGRILKAMSEAKVVNPVFMLDEMDKLNVSMSGDPMAALLEVIDPEQNHQFVDQYTEVDYNLSEVLFIGTANSSSKMYGALRDRLEIIEIPGYTDREKLEIAKQHLLPKQIVASGMESKELLLSDEIIMRLIRDYTKEAGVRNLERLIAKLCRKTVLAQDLKTEESKPVTKQVHKTTRITKAKLPTLLGAPMVFHALKRTDKVGIVNGLAVANDWEGIVHQIDALCMPGKGVKKTGNLKPHIEQSIDAALSILKANPSKYGLDPEFLNTNQVHIHYPYIDIAHEGNSNGLALFTLLVSVLNDIPMRTDTAMTGAVNLRGEACAVGGLRAKLVGAWRERIARVLIPQVQIRELTEIPEDIRAELEVIPVRNVEETLRHALLRLPTKRSSRKKAIQVPSRLATKSAESSAPIRH